MGIAPARPAYRTQCRAWQAHGVGADTSGSRQGYDGAGSRPAPFPSPWTAFTGFAPAVAQVLGRPSRQLGDSPLPSDECRRPD